MGGEEEEVAAIKQSSSLDINMNQYSPFISSPLSQKEEERILLT